MMASIVFGAGTSHTPMLNSAAEEWPLFEEIDRQRAHLHKDGRPATYDELLCVAPVSLRDEIAPEKLAWRDGEAMAAVERLRDGLVLQRGRVRRQEGARAALHGGDGVLHQLLRGRRQRERVRLLQQRRVQQPLRLQPRQRDVLRALLRQ